MNPQEKPSAEIEGVAPEVANPLDYLPEAEPTPEIHPHVIRALDLAREAEARTPKIQADHRESSRAAVRERLLHEFGEDWIAREALKRDSEARRAAIIAELEGKESPTDRELREAGIRLQNIGRDLGVVAEDERVHPMSATAEEIERSLKRYQAEREKNLQRTQGGEKPPRIFPVSKLRSIAATPKVPEAAAPVKKHGWTIRVGPGGRGEIEFPGGKKRIREVRFGQPGNKKNILLDAEKAELRGFASANPEIEPERVNLPHRGEWTVTERYPDGAVWISQGKYAGQRLEAEEYARLKSAEKSSEQHEASVEEENIPIFMRGEDGRVERWRLVRPGEDTVIFVSEHGRQVALTHDQVERLRRVQGILRGEYRSQGEPREPAKVERHPKLETGLKVGDFVLWENQGQLMFAAPKKIEDIMIAPDGKKFARLEGITTGVPYEELRPAPRVIERATEEESEPKHAPPKTVEEAIRKAETFEDLYGLIKLSGEIEAINPRTHELETWTPERLKQMVDDLRFPHKVKWEAFQAPHKLTKGEVGKEDLAKRHDENQRAFAEHLSAQMDKQVNINDFPMEFGIREAVARVMKLAREGKPIINEDKQEVEALDMEIGVATEALNAAKAEGRGEDAKKFEERIRDLEHLRDAKEALLSKPKTGEGALNFDEAMISGAKNFEELYKGLKEIGLIENKSGQEIELPNGEKVRGYTPARLKQIIEAFRGNLQAKNEYELSDISYGRVSARYIPEIYGLRKKVIELYRKEELAAVKAPLKKTGILGRIFGIRR